MVEKQGLQQLGYTLGTGSVFYALPSVSQHSACVCGMNLEMPRVLKASSEGTRQAEAEMVGHT